MHRCTALILAALLAFCAAAEDAKLDAETEKKADEAFQAGLSLSQKGKPAEALVEYKKALALTPKDPGVLWNTGISAQAQGENDLALDCWKKMREAEPDNWRVIAKLVQVYQAKDMKKERDEQRKLLLDTREKNMLNFADQPLYCREQLKVGEKKVMVMEHYELKGDHAVKYSFNVLNDKGETDYRISLGSYSVTAEFLKASGKVKEGDRGFHLDGYYEGGRSHKTFGFYYKEPTYDDIRPTVIKIIEGKVEAISGTRMGNDGGVEVEVKK